MRFIDVLMHFEHIPFVVEGRIDGLVKRRETPARKVNYRSVDLFDHSDRSGMDLIQFIILILSVCHLTSWACAGTRGRHVTCRPSAACLFVLP